MWPCADEIVAYLQSPWTRSCESEGQRTSQCPLTSRVSEQHQTLGELLADSHSTMAYRADDGDPMLRLEPLLRRRMVQQGRVLSSRRTTVYVARDRPDASVMRMWAWCMSRSTVAVAIVLGISSSNPEGWMFELIAIERFS